MHVYVRELCISKSKIVQAENRVLARAVRTRSQIAERERFIQYRAKARFQALPRCRQHSQWDYE